LDDGVHFDDPLTASNTIKEMINASGIKMGTIMPVMRAALTGQIQGPDIFEIAKVLGTQKTKERFRKMANWPM